jgi:hypothetical protein
VTLIVTSRVTVLQPLTAVRRYVRVLGGVTVNVPLSAASVVTVPVERSVIVREVVLETLKESVVLCPTLIVVAEAEYELMTASGVTVMARSRVTLPAPLATVSL